jgi:cellobiose transport system substrate-binding protein
LTAPQPFYGGQPTGAVFAKVAQESPTILITPKDNIVEKTLNQALTTVGQGKASAADAWASAQAQIAKQLQK